MEIRRSYDHLISKMGFPILVRWHLYIESGPRLHPRWCSCTVQSLVQQDFNNTKICDLNRTKYEIGTEYGCMAMQNSTHFIKIKPTHHCLLHVLPSNFRNAWSKYEIGDMPVNAHSSNTTNCRMDSAHIWYLWVKKLRKRYCIEYVSIIKVNFPYWQATQC